MREYLRRAHWAPWTGLVAAPLAWAVHHQVGSDVNFWNCGDSDFIAILLGIVAALAAAASGWISWAARPHPSGESDVRVFAGMLGAGAAGLFTVAILFQTLAAVILPECFR